uniref:Uncharacterized protein n=1 Tax=Arundo donax TaxID=35708 RepID=A0A0A9EM60_ARUDO
MMMTVTLKPHHWRIASTARIVVAFPILPSSIALREGRKVEEELETSKNRSLMYRLINQ